MHASDRAVESTSAVEGPSEALLADVLREGGGIAFGVRLRIALDVLEQAANKGAALRARAPTGGLRLETVRVGGDGIAHHAGDDTSGVGEIAWEIIAGRKLEGDPVPLRQIADDVTEAVEDLVARLLARDETPLDLESAARALEEAGRGYLDTHEDVRHAMGLDREAMEEVAVSVAPPSMSRVPASAAAAAAAEDTEQAAVVSARAADPPEPGLLEQVDASWPTADSTKPPPPVKPTALPDATAVVATAVPEPRPSEVSAGVPIVPVVAAPPGAALDEATPEGSREDSADDFGAGLPRLWEYEEELESEAPTTVRPTTTRAPTSRSAPASASLRDSEPDDRPTPDEPTMLRKGEFGLIRRVIRAAPIRQPTEEPSQPTPGPSPSDRASGPGLLASEAGGTVSLFDEDSDVSGQEAEEKNLYRSRAPSVQARNKSSPASSEAGTAARTKRRALARREEPPAALEPESEPPDDEMEHGRTRSAASWLRTMLIALLIGGLLAVVVFELR